LGGLKTGASLEGGLEEVCEMRPMHVPQAGQFADQGGQLAGELLHLLLLGEDE
jgi:hypothetical protein